MSLYKSIVICKPHNFKSHATCTYAKEMDISPILGNLDLFMFHYTNAPQMYRDDVIIVHATCINTMNDGMTHHFIIKNPD